jgi:hypothetical protein
VRTRKRKIAPATQGFGFTRPTLSADLQDSLKLISASRKAQGDKSNQPSYLNGIVDEAIAKLAAMLKSGADVNFVPLPTKNAARPTYRISPASHKLAVAASENAGVKLGDFIRTALTLYVRSHASEIYKEAKPAANRARKPARR